LSVEPDNHARRLYKRLGFETVGAVGGSLTMLLRL
jgi:ribosomal protein S18 acetylase RimI-like enzyme